ncbi:DUF3073 domain-containing protein [Cryobacterium melibiosiphilum]|uniref:DUF3073 domain-containing protein n=1 Tax=Cryobacterium melibiosiphilum TaxID=995039 RepID=A0A3A5MMK8_9MICO|nr:DUF3073 domain-containing protein [Cryobacterium melibiosiphilum]RJT89079.1 DUF3073 domain-containing protein [Cryobacterium melibiosiphilum]
MGRGRQKAKHTKVARELKYFSPDTNYNALERELTGHPADPRLDEDLAKWPEYEKEKAEKAEAAKNEAADDESDEDERYVDHYATDQYASEDEQRRA